MRLRLQQEENRSRSNQEDDGDSHRKSDRRRLATPDGPSSDLLREMRKEMDELRNTIKGKMDRSLDRMVRTTDSPFTHGFETQTAQRTEQRRGSTFLRSDRG